MKIITDGKDLYAIQKGIWSFYSYFDLKAPGFWWNKNSRFFLECWGTSERVEYLYGLLKPKISKKHRNKMIELFSFLTIFSALLLILSIPAYFIFKSGFIQGFEKGFYKGYEKCIDDINDISPETINKIYNKINVKKND